MKNVFRVGNLVVDISFKDFLYMNSCRISDMILGFETLTDINYIGVTDKIDTVSYLPSSKLSAVVASGIDPYADGIGRTYIKIGRLVSKIFPKDVIKSYINHSDVEAFVNSYKSFFDESNKKMVVVSGADVVKYYYAGTYCYPDTGTLWKSCMRHRGCKSFLELYEKNPDKVKMVILFTDQDGQQKVRGRALLWEAEDMSGNKVRIMDRIYTIFDSDVFVFKKWGRENGYISKFYQNAKTPSIFEVDGKEMILNLTVKLDIHSFSFYPYLDSFQFFNMSEGVLYNNTYSYYEFHLVQSDGRLCKFEDDEEPEEPEEDWDDVGPWFDDDGPGLI